MLINPLSMFYGITRLLTGDNFVGNSLRNTFNKYTGNGLTSADKEAAELQYNLNESAADNALARKVDFYKQYESISAQAQQYRDAGFNPMLLATGGATTSASSAPQGNGTAVSPSSGDISSLLGAITGLMGLGIQQQNADTNRMNAETERSAVESNNSLNSAKEILVKAQAEGQEIDNDFAAAEHESSIAQRDAQTEYINECVNSEYMKQALISAQIVNIATDSELKAMEIALKSVELEYASDLYEAQLRMDNSAAKLNLTRAMQSDAERKKVEQEYKEAVMTYQARCDAVIKKAQAEGKFADKKEQAEVRNLNSKTISNYMIGTGAVLKGVADLVGNVVPQVRAVQAFGDGMKVLSEGLSQNIKKELSYSDVSRKMMSKHTRRFYQ